MSILKCVQFLTFESFVLYYCFLIFFLVCGLIVSLPLVKKKIAVPSIYAILQSALRFFPVNGKCSINVTYFIIIIILFKKLQDKSFNV